MQYKGQKARAQSNMAYNREYLNIINPKANFLDKFMGADNVTMNGCLLPQRSCQSSSLVYNFMVT